MTEGPPSYHIGNAEILPDGTIFFFRCPELFTITIPDGEPGPPASIAPLPKLTPTPANRLLDLLEQLPEGLDASSRDTNQFELVSPHDAESYWWLDIGEMLQHAYTHNPHTYGQTLDRLQLLLDLAVAAKAAEPWLRYRSEQPLYVNPPGNST